VEQSAKFSEIRVPLLEPVHGLDSVSAVRGVPEWWATGSRVAVALAHDEGSNLDDPLIRLLHEELTKRRYLTIRFNFPFAEARAAGKRRRKPDAPEVLEMAYRCALSAMAGDPEMTPAHLILAGKGLGARVAAGLATQRLQIDGLVCLAYPLHTAGQAGNPDADALYRIISPMLFVQGSQDERCDLATLRDCLHRVGAPSRLQPVQDADRNLVVSGASSEQRDLLDAGIANAVGTWIEGLVGTPQ
jgi:predicted alpha/beta-hydrolase family hydrolase